MACITGKVAIRVAAIDVARLGLLSSTISTPDNSAVTVVHAADTRERGPCGPRVNNGRSSFSGELCGCDVADPASLSTLANATITVTEQSGRVHTMRGGDAIGEFPYSTDTGVLQFRFESRQNILVG